MVYILVNKYSFIFQALFQLLESEVTIRCRKEDLDLIKVCCKVLQC